MAAAAFRVTACIQRIHDKFPEKKIFLQISSLIDFS